MVGDRAVGIAHEERVRFDCQVIDNSKNNAMHGDPLAEKHMCRGQITQVYKTSVPGVTDVSGQSDVIQHYTATPSRFERRNAPIIVEPHTDPFTIQSLRCAVGTSGHSFGGGGRGGSCVAS